MEKVRVVDNTVQLSRRALRSAIYAILLTTTLAGSAYAAEGTNPQIPADTSRMREYGSKAEIVYSGKSLLDAAQLPSILVGAEAGIKSITESAGWPQKTNPEASY